MPGSWTKRGKDAYKLTVCIGTDFKGTPNRFTKTVHCKSDKEADKELAKFYTACESGNVAKQSTVTVKAFSEKWLAEYVEIKCKRSAIAGYKSALNIHIHPTFGTRKLTSISALHVQEWVNSMLRNNLSPKTIRNYFSVFRGMMQSALKWGFISHNPCDLVDMPPRNRKETDFYNKEELLLLLAKLQTVSNKDLKYKVAILTALLCGMRKGEISGLNWEDIDMEKRTLKICRTRMYIHNYGLIEDTPKTVKSSRVIDAPEELIREYKKLFIQEKQKRLLAGSKWADSSAVFTNGFGEPLSPPMLALWFDAFLKNEGLRHSSLHKLRHTYTSMLIYLDIDLTQISHNLGHSQKTTTLNIYGHMLEDKGHEIADKISSSFLSIANKN